MENLTTIDPLAAEQNVKKIFRKKGACSTTFHYLLNREFDNVSETNEYASFQLAGGILGLGHQCGMLWGASMAAGFEAYKISDNMDQAISLSILATQNIMKSFSDRTNTYDCREITNCDFASKLSMAKYFITGRFMRCFNLAKKWAPEAINTAKKSLTNNNQVDLSTHTVSCASEVAKKMGASDEEIVIVAGFAGGLGLSGNACGALSAAVWINSLEYYKDHHKDNSFPNPAAIDTLNTFYTATNKEILCSKITGRKFATLEDHSHFIINGGCKGLIDFLSREN